MACPGYQSGFAVTSAHDPAKPHIVTPLASGEVRCRGCPQNDRLSICSHSVAVAERKSILRKFLAWYKKNRDKANFSQAANQGMPNGRGKKGERAPRKQKSKVGQKAVPTDFVDRLQVPSYCSHTVTVNTCSAPVTPTSAMMQPVAVQSMVSAMPLQSDGCIQAVTGMHLAVSSPVAVRQTAPALSSSTAMLSSAMPMAINQPPIGRQSPDFQSMPTVHGSTPMQPLQGYNSAPQHCGTPFNVQPYHNSNPFILQFQHGNIRKCAGCGGQIEKRSGLPQNLVLQHMERYQYPTGNPFEPIKYTVNKERSHYYHARKTCILNRHPYFNTSMIDVTVVQNALSEQHKLQLIIELDLFLP